MSTEKMDDASVEFVRQQSNVQMSMAVLNLIRAGYDPESAVDALTSGDMTRLKCSGEVTKP